MSKQYLKDGILTIGSDSWGFRNIAVDDVKTMMSSADTSGVNTVLTGKENMEFAANIISDGDHPISPTEVAQATTIRFGLREYSGNAVILEVKQNAQVGDAIINTVKGIFKGTSTYIGVDISLIPIPASAMAGILGPLVTLPPINIAPGFVSAQIETIDPVIISSDTYVLPGSIYALATVVDPTVAIDLPILPLPSSVIAGKVDPIYEQAVPEYKVGFDGDDWLDVPYNLDISNDFSFDFEFYWVDIPTTGNYHIVWALGNDTLSDPIMQVAIRNHAIGSYVSLWVGDDSGDYWRIGTGDTPYGFCTKDNWNRIQVSRESGVFYLRLWDADDILYERSSAPPTGDTYTFNLGTIGAGRSVWWMGTPVVSNHVPDEFLLRNLNGPYELGVAFTDIAQTTVAGEGEEIASINNVGFLAGNFEQSTVGYRPVKYVLPAWETMVAMEVGYVLTNARLVYQNFNFSLPPGSQIYEIIVLYDDISQMSRFGAAWITFDVMNTVNGHWYLCLTDAPATTVEEVFYQGERCIRYVGILYDQTPEFGPNLLSDWEFEVDSNGDGLADGWIDESNIPPTFSIVEDSGIIPEQYFQNIYDLSSNNDYRISHPISLQNGITYNVRVKFGRLDGITIWGISARFPSQVAYQSQQPPTSPNTVGWGQFTANSDKTEVMISTVRQSYDEYIFDIYDVIVYVYLGVAT